ncbi:hypothetical protein BSLG_001649 [Batrachochytrium salamandrivorans]|nr:hypothetical protein BSLG_001649 [Batrachochytrium salamandrivorans]
MLQASKHRLARIPVQLLQLLSEHRCLWGRPASGEENIPLPGSTCIDRQRYRTGILWIRDAVLKGRNPLSAGERIGREVRHHGRQEHRTAEAGAGAQIGFLRTAEDYYDVSRKMR